MSYGYQSLADYLGEKDKKYIKRSEMKTWVERSGDHLTIWMNKTAIMEYYPDGSVELKTGGWQTSTTKLRLNEYIPKPWRIYQDKGVWWLSNINYYTKEGNKYMFAEGITIHPDGSVSGAGSVKETQDLRKQIDKYVSGFMKALVAGEVPAPSQGDCWYCSMVTADGNVPLGEAIGDTSHLLSHFEEEYFVPTLLMNACGINSGDMKISQVAMWWLGGLWQDDQKVEVWADMAQKQIGKALKQYLKAQFGLVR